MILYFYFYLLEQLALSIWKKHLFFPDNQKLFTDFFEKVEQERDRGSVNLDILKEITQSLCKLDYLNEKVVVEKFSVNQRETYKALFEDTMVKLTGKYYEREANIKVNSMSISDYMIYVK